MSNRTIAPAVALLALAAGGFGASRAEAGFVQLPRSSTGMRWYCPVASHHWGTPRLVNKLLLLGRSWRRSTGGTVRVGDMSLPRGGRFRPHATHRDGKAADLGTMGSTARNQRFVNLMHGTGGVSFILFNGRGIRGVRRAAGHNDHMHLQIR